MRLLLLCAATMLASSAIAAAPIPVTAFAERNTYSGPKISPDGKHLAINVRMKRGERTVPTLTILTLPDLKLVSQFGLPGFELLWNYHWVSDQRLVGDKAMEVGFKETPDATGELLAFDLDGTHVDYLYGYDMFKSSSKGNRYPDDYGWADVIRAPRERNGHVLVSAYEWRGHSSEVIDINTQTAIRKTLAHLYERRFDFVLQDDGTPRFAYGVDNDDEPVLYRNDGTEWKKQPAAMAKSFHPSVISADAKTVYSWYSKAGEPSALVSYSMDDGTMKHLAGAPDSAIGYVFWSLGDRNVPLGWSKATGVPQMMYLDQNDPDVQLHKTLSAQFPGESLRFVSDSRDGQRVIFWVGSDRDPGAYYLFDRATGNAKMLFANLPDIDAEQMAERRPITYKARDGWSIEAILTLPPNPAHKKLPLIVMPHGGPIGIHDQWFFDTEAQFLASRGYMVLQPNYRGSSSRGKNFQDAGMREYGGKMIDDMVDGLKWTLANQDADPARVCSYGSSYGGYAAMMLPIRAPGMFKCAVGYAGRYDLVVKETEEGVLGEKAVQAWIRKYVGTDPEALRRESPAYNAEKVKVPVLLIHGGQDKTCPVSQYELMRDNLVKAGNTPEILFEPKEGHGFFNDANRVKELERLEAFLAKQLGK
jgi:dienelactone hydrolase